MLALSSLLIHADDLQMLGKSMINFSSTFTLGLIPKGSQHYVAFMHVMQLANLKDGAR